MTAPPPPDLPAWPEITWGVSFFGQPPDGFTSERVAALAASDVGFVAIGLAEATGRDLGQIWFSSDGIEWDRVGVPATLEGVSLLDVAAGPGGFVAIGDVAGDPFLANETGIVLFRSPDGRRWERVPVVPGMVAGLASGIGGGPSGYVAAGFTDPEPGPIILVSDDGVAWTAVAPADSGDAALGITSPTPSGDGWIAVGGPAETLSVLHSDDGVRWTGSVVEDRDTNGIALTDLVVGPGGFLAIGIVGDDCGPFSSCPAESMLWWSADGLTWGRVTEPDPTVALGAVASDPVRGFVSIRGPETWASPDGWAWTTLGDLGGFGAVDAVVRGDLIVAVGDRTEADGSTRAAFAVGGPDIEVLDQGHRSPTEVAKHRRRSTAWRRL